jgi:hypothetical protein
MACDPNTLRQIYRCTAGYCHRCRRKLAFSGYARATVRGAWDIDACLRPACSGCLGAPPAPGDRRAVDTLAPPAALSRPRRPPLPVPQRTPACRHTVLGGLLGAFVAGPWGALLGGLLGSFADGGEAT